MKSLNQTEMMETLKKRFPSLSITDGVEFSSEYKPGTSIWLRNASSTPYTDKDSNPISSLDTGIQDDVKTYDLNVYVKFYEWCRRYGWYPTTEDYTMMLLQ